MSLFLVAAVLASTSSAQNSFLQFGNATLAVSDDGPSVTIVNHCDEGLYSPPGQETSQTYWTSGSSVAVKVGPGACGTLAEFHFDPVFNGGGVWWDISVIKGYNYAISSNVESCYDANCDIGYKLCCTACLQGTQFSKGAVTFTFCPDGQTAKSESCCGPSPPPTPPGPSWYKTITPSSNTNLCVDLPGNDPTNGNPLWLWECNGQESQRWVFDSYQVRFGADESKCVDAGEMGNGKQLSLWDCNGSPQQTWGFDADVSRFYLADTATCLDFYGDWQSNGQPLHVWDCSGDWNQEWSIWNVGSGSLNTVGNGTALMFV